MPSGAENFSRGLGLTARKRDILIYKCWGGIPFFCLRQKGQFRLLLAVSPKTTNAYNDAKNFLMRLRVPAYSLFFATAFALTELGGSLEKSLKDSGFSALVLYGRSSVPDALEKFRILLRFLEVSFATIIEAKRARYEPTPVGVVAN